MKRRLWRVRRLRALLIVGNWPSSHSRSTTNLRRIWQPDSTISAECTEVFDVTQTSVVGKKGRMAAHVQILVSPRELDSVIVACFEETTTIGLRYQLTEGAILRRRLETIEMEGGDNLQVKIVERPGGMQSGKAEAADVAGHRGHLKRSRLRGEAVALALGPRDQNRTGAGDEAE